MRCGILLDKKTNVGSSKPLIVAHGELWPGFSAVVILQHKWLYNKVQHLKKCIFSLMIGMHLQKCYPQNAMLLEKLIPVVSNSNTRARVIIWADLREKQKLLLRNVTTKREMIDTPLKLWQVLTESNMFKSFQDVALIYLYVSTLHLKCSNRIQNHYPIHCGYFVT